MFHVIILLIMPSLAFMFDSFALNLCKSAFYKNYKVIQTEQIEFQG